MTVQTLSTHWFVFWGLVSVGLLLIKLVVVLIVMKRINRSPRNVPPRYPVAPYQPPIHPVPPYQPPSGPYYAPPQPPQPGQPPR